MNIGVRYDLVLAAFLKKTPGSMFILRPRKRPVFFFNRTYNINFYLKVGIISHLMLLQLW